VPVPGGNYQMRMTHRIITAKSLANLWSRPTSGGVTFSSSPCRTRRGRGIYAFLWSGCWAKDSAGEARPTRHAGQRNHVHLPGGRIPADLEGVCQYGRGIQGFKLCSTYLRMRQRGAHFCKTIRRGDQSMLEGHPCARWRYSVIPVDGRPAYSESRLRVQPASAT